MRVLETVWLVTLDSRGVTDADLAHLKGLKHLVRLSGLEDLLLRKTAVTDSGVAKLKQALPDLRVAQ